MEEEGVAKPGEGPRVDVVTNQRVSRTRVSFSWMDGEKGPIAMTLADADIKSKALKKVVEESGWRLSKMYVLYVPTSKNFKGI